VTLKADAKAGTWIRDWCWKNGMILRNNGNILVLAPSLIITREQVDEMLGLIDRALTEAEREFGVG
jgi:putrescine aminotransferase